MKSYQPYTEKNDSDFAKKKHSYSSVLPRYPWDIADHQDDKQIVRVI